MKIAHIAAECAPIAKVGGLADVVYGLGKALKAHGHTPLLLLPKYDTLDLTSLEGIQREPIPLTFPFNHKTHTATLWRGNLEGIELYLLEPLGEEDFFGRGTIYGCSDDIARFIYFCLAAVAFLRSRSVDVIHLHDWHTALIAPLIRQLYKELSIPLIFTIHNLSYQGHCSLSDLSSLGLELEPLRQGEGYNLLQGGIFYADRVTTVSPTYADEILTPQWGCGLDLLLQKNTLKLSGILNGIDYTYWNPLTDPLIPSHFDFSCYEKKQQSKELLCKRLGLEVNGSPLVGAITRLVPQKGPGLLEAALRKTVQKGGRFVLLGSALDKETQHHFVRLKEEFAGSRQVHLELAYDEALSHWVFAAADLFLVPSLFEPCGLTQMIAMRYGALPLVRQTGGLADTVFEGKNGFVFGPPTPAALGEALDRAFELWHSDPAQWKKLVRAGMEHDFSWKEPAQSYLNLYTSSCSPLSMSNFNT